MHLRLRSERRRPPIKTLILDIETSPNVAHVWGLFKQNVSLSQLRETGQVLSFAAKWHGAPGVLFYSDFHDGHETMVRAAHGLLMEADAVVHYNGTTFDMPWLRREFILADLPPTSPVKNIDLLRVVQKQFRFTSNKLDHISQQLGFGAKVTHTGHDLWVRCLNGDEKAWALMRRYNIGDVRITEKVYDRLLPWIQGHPHKGLYDNATEEVCQRCGSNDLRKEGFAYTALGKFQQYQCRKCKGWMRAGKRLSNVDLRHIAA